MAGTIRCDEEERSWTKFDGFLRKYDKDCINNKTGSQMIVATVIATMTFQTAVNPPGGVWQESKRNGIDCNPKCTAGTSVLDHKGDTEYLIFQIYNSMAFVSSVAIIFLLISGFPVEHRPCMWLCNILNCSALAFLTLTFRQGISLVSPSTFDGLKNYSIWGPFIGVMILLQIIRILIWIVKFQKNRRRRTTTSGPTQI